MLPRMSVTLSRDARVVRAPSDSDLFVPTERCRVRRRYFQPCAPLASACIGDIRHPSLILVPCPDIDTIAGTHYRKRSIDGGRRCKHPNAGLLEGRRDDVMRSDTATKRDKSRPPIEPLEQVHATQSAQPTQPTQPTQPAQPSATAQFVPHDATELVRALIGRVHGAAAPPSDEREEIVLSVEVDGAQYLLTRLKPAPLDAVSLSPREREIARMVAQGLSDKTIAAVLEISRYTVATHLRRMYAKMAVTTRAAMVGKIMNQSPRWPVARPPSGEKR